MKVEINNNYPDVVANDLIEYFSAFAEKLSQPTPKKVKLTKLYCSDDSDDYKISYYKDINDAKVEWTYVYTEQEFKEKFDVEI